MGTAIKSSKQQATNWLLVGGSLVTLFIWSNLADPFNAPKSWVLAISAAYLSGWLAFQIKDSLQNSVLKLALLLGGAFLAALFISFLFTNEKYVGFFGENARRTGFLTYFSLTIFFLSAALIFRASSISKFDVVTLIVGPLVGLYGFLQHFKIDAISWNNPYNSVLSTLGNPDFASAVMGIFLVVSVGIILNQKKAMWARIFAAGSTLLLTVTIIFSQARQGLLAALIGVAIIVIVWVSQKNRVAGYSVAGVGVLGLIIGILGMLNDGPLAKYLYKVSVTYRGDYWRAGINMFKHHFLFGVGLDRYGAYFRQYRDATQSLRRGPDIISNAAHNVPIQLAATGGIFVLLAFLALFFLIAWRGVVAIRNSSGNQKIVVSSFVGAWVTYEAQSFISIDNVGIAIWGWLIGGIIVGLSIVEVEEEVSMAPTYATSKKNKKKNSLPRQKESIAQPLISGVAATAMLALVIPLFLADSAARMSRAYSKPTSDQVNAYVTAVKKPLGFGIVDPHNKVVVGILLAEANQVPEGEKLLQDVASSDSQAGEAMTALASIYEQTNKIAQAIPLRKKLVVLDPFNQKNLLKLGQDLKLTGDIAGAKAMIPLIDAFAASTPEAAQAKSEFGA